MISAYIRANTQELASAGMKNGSRAVALYHPACPVQPGFAECHTVISTRRAPLPESMIAGDLALSSKLQEPVISDGVSGPWWIRPKRPRLVLRSVFWPLTRGASGVKDVGAEHFVLQSLLLLVPDRPQ